MIQLQLRKKQTHRKKTINNRFVYRTKYDGFNKHSLTEYLQDKNKKNSFFFDNQYFIL